MTTPTIVLSLSAALMTGFAAVVSTRLRQHQPAYAASRDSTPRTSTCAPRKDYSVFPTCGAYPVGPPLAVRNRVATW